MELISIAALTVGGFALMALKAPKFTARAVKKFPLVSDIAITTLCFILFAGTFSGMVTAALAAGMASVLILLGHYVLNFRLPARRHAP